MYMYRLIRLSNFERSFGQYPVSRKARYRLKPRELQTHAQTLNQSASSTVNKQADAVQFGRSQQSFWGGGINYTYSVQHKTNFNSTCFGLYWSHLQERQYKNVNWNSFVRICIETAEYDSVQAETRSRHLKATTWIKIKLCRFKLNNYGLLSDAHDWMTFTKSVSTHLPPPSSGQKMIMDAYQSNFTLLWEIRSGQT